MDVIEMKKKLNKRSVFYIAAAVILIGVLLFSGFQALRIYIPQSYDSRNFEDLKKEANIKSVKADDVIAAASEIAENPKKQEADLSVLKKMNSDFEGWLSIEDTDIDYPVMKSSEDDPEFYLHRDFEKNSSSSGCLFIGEGCDIDSDAFVVYGHNMNSGTMFGTLDSYSDAVFAQEHKNIVLSTPEGDRVYRVFAAFQTKIYSEPTDAFEYYRMVGKLDRKLYKNTVDNIRSLSLISLNEAPKYPRQIMMLSTCAYHTDEGRFVVAAYRIV